ncbi:MAG: transglycosylase SLT domain-containing protein, partial [Campylobacterales bacterium]|nr:transglycosylase SLT domain-containing protein [Campylobacterales bacterium]
MNKLIGMLLLTIGLMYASIAPKNSTLSELQVLTTLQIDSSFLSTQEYKSIKSNFRELTKQDIAEKLKSGYYFLPPLQDLLSKSVVPDMFLYLAMIESDFNINTTSDKNAKGIWQFLPYTATLYGLKINDFVDERKDPIKSTEAALNYLTKLHNKFGKWYLAAIAYNCGEGALQKAIENAGSDDLSVLLSDNNKYLPNESKQFIKKLIASALFAQNSKTANLDELSKMLNKGSSQTIASVKVNGGASLFDIAKSMYISTKELKKYNRHLTQDVVPPVKKDYQIYIPYNKLALFKANYKPQKSTQIVTHTIAKGESLYTIAKKYAVKIEDLKDINGLTSNNLK